MHAPRRGTLLVVWVGLGLEAINQLDRWRRLAGDSYEPYGASFVRAHLLAYAGVLIALAGLAWLWARSQGAARRFAGVALVGSITQAIGLAADIPSHLSGTDSEVAHVVGYLGLAVELAALVPLARRSQR